MNALERGILRTLRDCLVGDKQLARRVERLEAKVEQLERGHYAPPELLTRLETVRDKLRAIR